MKLKVQDIVLNEHDAKLYILTAEDGSELKLVNYGARMVDLIVPDKDGTKTDILLGDDIASGKISERSNMGAVVGRYANRIAGGSFVLNGIRYDLCKNNGNNTLHGGKVGFSNKFWDSEAIGNDTVVFTLLSPDGDENFPGNLKVKATYSFSDKHELKLSYYAISDRDTIINLTNHAYFNLNGHGSGSIENHSLFINSDYYIPTDEAMIPTGEVASVEGTPFDFRTPTEIGKRIGEDNAQLKIAGGYDHSYVFKDGNAVKAVGDKSGIVMEIETTLPAMQLYTGNFMRDSIGKYNASYGKRGGVCFETHFLPDSIHHENFPSTVLRKDEEFYHETVFKLSIAKA